MGGVLRKAGLVFAVMCVVAAGVVGWSAHQASDEAHRVRAETRALEAQRKAAEHETADANAHRDTDAARTHRLMLAFDEVRRNVSPLAIGVSLTTASVDSAIQTFNGQVHMGPARVPASARAHIDSAVQDVEQHAGIAHDDLGLLEKSVAALAKVPS